MKPLALALAALSLSACGYHVGGRADLIPSSVRTICIPAFSNATPRYKLTETFPNAIAQEFIARTRYRIVSDPNQADAILRGAVLNYNAYTTLLDQRTGRAAGIQLSVFLDFTLTERATGKVLFERRSTEFKGRYEISTDQAQYLDESNVALNRLAGEVARQVVSSILEAF